MKSMKRLAAFALCLCTLSSLAQSDRWQQRAEYEMDIDVDVASHQYTGSQKITYTNNSPDALDKVFYHLYFNAFQPGSMMDVRSRTIEDPDPRVADRILHLPEDEQGWIKVKSLKMNGKKVDFATVGTILEVELKKAIKPGAKVVFEMEWDAQVPRQVRRSGWMNKEGVEFSMTQWYPKLCEYDYEGWHAHPYVGREYYGVWGDFNVNITIDHNYTIGGTGVLQNPDEIGHGYSEVTPRPSGDKLTWKFKAENVHDFAWAADPDFVHDMQTMDNGTVMHFIYQNDPEYRQNWVDFQPLVVRAFEYMNKEFGVYPYPQFTVIQGGDGGMEYPMSTLITGDRNMRSLTGVTVHEGAHSWYYGALGTNENFYEWMDEGFTSFATSKTMNEIFGSNQENPHNYAYQGYLSLARDGKEEPLITNADHYTTNHAYGVAAYSKGQVLLAQLGYVIGNDVRDRGLRRYFEEWKFKHPNPTDFKRVMEKESGIELDWYFEYFTGTTKTIDYGVGKIVGTEGKTHITLERLGLMPMPVDLLVEYKDGSSEIYNIPLQIMRGYKQTSEKGTWSLMEDWPWTNPEYVVELDIPVASIKRIEIDPSGLLADIDRENNRVDFHEEIDFIWMK